MDAVFAPTLDPNGGARDFILPETHFQSSTCAVDPSRGDVLVHEDGFVTVVRRANSVDDLGVVFDLRVTLIIGARLSSVRRRAWHAMQRFTCRLTS